MKHEMMRQTETLFALAGHVKERLTAAQRRAYAFTASLLARVCIVFSAVQTGRIAFGESRAAENNMILGIRTPGGGRWYG